MRWDAYEVLGREFRDGFIFFNDFGRQAFDERVKIFLRLAKVRIMH